MLVGAYAYTYMCRQSLHSSAFSYRFFLSLKVKRCSGTNFHGTAFYFCQISTRVLQQAFSEADYLATYVPTHTMVSPAPRSQYERFRSYDLVAGLLNLYGPYQPFDDALTVSIMPLIMHCHQRLSSTTDFYQPSWHSPPVPDSCLQSRTRRHTDLYG